MMRPGDRCVSLKDPSRLGVVLRAIEPTVMPGIAPPPGTYHIEWDDGTRDGEMCLVVLEWDAAPAPPGAPRRPAARPAPEKDTIVSSESGEAGSHFPGRSPAPILERFKSIINDTK